MDMPFTAPPVNELPNIQETKPVEQDDGPADWNLLEATLFPADSFAGRIYWADLKGSERRTWMNKQHGDEAKRELKILGRMFKEDPLSPVREYSRRYGLFLEGFTLFSIGNLKSLFQLVWPACWKSNTTCDKNWIAAIEYLEIIGIMIGQFVVGFEADWIGRKAGLVQDALVMTLGLVMLTAMWGTSLNGWVICYAWSLFIYGFGVGGEYPMTATTTLEPKALRPGEVRSHTDDRLHRGRNVSLAFLMQGWGQLFNQGLLIILLLIFHGGGNPPYSATSTQYTFRVSFGIVAVMTLWLAYHRYYRSSHSKALETAKKRTNVSGYDTASLKQLISHFPMRLLGTAGCWFANDFFFYGSKLFQSSFITVITPDAKGNVMPGWLYNLINIGVSLVGYYMAAFFIDDKRYGRVRMQATGFFFCFIMMIISAFNYTNLVKPENIHGFQTVYYLASFFNQFGPNATTFLLAAEVYPTSVRATAHGFSACCGKFGALLPAIIYNFVGTRTKFYIVWPFGIIGFILTIICVPDVTGLDLRETERYWMYVKQGRAHEYHGIAVHPRHLSWWEIHILKRHLAYNPELDREQKIEELRALFDLQSRQQGEEVLGHDVLDADETLASDVTKFFSNKSGVPQKHRSALHDQVEGNYMRKRSTSISYPPFPPSSSRHH